jgi:hypothetical protein
MNFPTSEDASAAFVSVVTRTHIRAAKQSLIRITTWSEVFVEKITVAQRVNKFHAFMKK